MKKSIVIILLLFIIFSCSKKIAPIAVKQPPEQSTDTVSTSILVDITVAESMFKETCASCHKLPNPAKHIAAEWPNVVARMQRKRLGFDDARKMQILAYLVANAKQ